MPTRGSVSHGGTARHTSLLEDGSWMYFRVPAAGEATVDSLLHVLPCRLDLPCRRVRGGGLSNCQAPSGVPVGYGTRRSADMRAPTLATLAPRTWRVSPSGVVVNQTHSNSTSEDGGAPSLEWAIGTHGEICGCSYPCHHCAYQAHLFNAAQGHAEVSLGSGLTWSTGHVLG